MRNGYRILTAAIALAAFILAIAAVGASGPSDAEDPPKTGTCGSGLTWTYTTSDNTLEIKFTNTPGANGIMDDYASKANQPWADFRGQIEKLAIGYGVASIGSNAFAECSSLTSMTLSDKVDSKLKSIGSNAFAGCSNLTNFTVKYAGDGTGIMKHFSSSDSPYKKMPLVHLNIVGFSNIGEYAFDGIGTLRSVTFDENLTEIGKDAFAVCHALNEVVLPEGLTTIKDGAFKSCHSLYSVTLPSTIDATECGTSYFDNCMSLFEVINHTDTELKSKSTEYGGVAANAKRIVNDPGNKDGTTSSIVRTESGFVYGTDDDNEYYGILFDCASKEEGGCDVILPYNIGGEPYSLFQYFHTIIDGELCKVPKGTNIYVPLGVEGLDLDNRPFYNNASTSNNGWYIWFGTSTNNNQIPQAGYYYTSTGDTVENRYKTDALKAIGLVTDEADYKVLHWGGNEWSEIDSNLFTHRLYDFELYMYGYGNDNCLHIMDRAGTETYRITATPKNGEGRLLGFTNVGESLGYCLGCNGPLVLTAVFGEAYTVELDSDVNDVEFSVEDEDAIYSWDKSRQPIYVPSGNELKLTLKGVQGDVYAWDNGVEFVPETDVNDRILEIKEDGNVPHKVLAYLSVYTVSVDTGVAGITYDLKEGGNTISGSIEVPSQSTTPYQFHAKPGWHLTVRLPDSQEPSGGFIVYDSADSKTVSSAPDHGGTYGIDDIKSDHALKIIAAADVCKVQIEVQDGIHPISEISNGGEPVLPAGAFTSPIYMDAGMDLEIEPTTKAVEPPPFALYDNGAYHQVEQTASYTISDINGDHGIRIYLEDDSFVDLTIGLGTGVDAKYSIGDMAETPVTPETIRVKSGWSISTYPSFPENAAEFVYTVNNVPFAVELPGAYKLEPSEETKIFIDARITDPDDEHYAEHAYSPVGVSVGDGIDAEIKIDGTAVPGTGAGTLMVRNGSSLSISIKSETGMAVLTDNGVRYAYRTGQSHTVPAVSQEHAIAIVSGQSEEFAVMEAVYDPGIGLSYSLDGGPVTGWDGSALDFAIGWTFVLHIASNDPSVPDGTDAVIIDGSMKLPTSVGGSFDFGRLDGGHRLDVRVWGEGHTPFYRISAVPSEGGETSPGQSGDYLFLLMEGAVWQRDGDALTFSDDAGAYTLRAIPGEGYSFSRFLSGGEGIADSGTVLSDMAVSAEWAEWLLTVAFLPGDGGQGAMKDQVIRYSDADRSLAPNTFTKKGCSFSGWKDASGTDLPDGADVSLLIVSPDSELDLTAQWTSDPVPGPTPRPPAVTVRVSFEPTTGGKVSMDSAKIPLNAKVTVNGDTLIIGSGSSKTIVKAEPFNGFVFDSWSIEDGNILSDSSIVAMFRAVTLSGISVESSPAKTEYKEGEKFDPTGLVVIAGFDDMSSMTMGYDGNKGLFTFSPSLDTPLSSDDTTVTVYYNGQSTDVAITVTSDFGDDTVMYAAIGVAVAVALAAVAAFFLIRKP